MKKLNTSPISGTLELLPPAQNQFDDLKSRINHVFQLHGFQNLETPVLERTEILFAKAGGDTEKQIYEVKKTGESPDTPADQALRFDHTVPLARYIVEHENDLNFPFKTYQIGKNFRGERAQKGRFREFYQCDVDVIGRNSLPLFYDVEIISTLIDTYRSFKLSTPVVARISNRKILKGFLEGLNLQDKSKDISSVIDHAEKVPPEKTEQSLTEIGLNDNEKQKVLDFIDLSGPLDAVVSGLKNLGVDNPTLDEGINELTTIIELLGSAGYESNITADLKIIRGLDYYTGTVFEFALPDYPEVGSIGGGGRYENLTEYFSDQKFPGVGGSIGLNRLFSILTDKNLLPEISPKSVDYAIIPISDQEVPYALKVAQDLQAQNHSASLIVTNKKLGDKLNLAATLSSNAIVIGENEAKTGTYEVRQFK